MSTLQRFPATIQWYPAGDGYERAVVFEPGWNDRAGKYGVHGMEIRFLLRGPKGAVNFVMSTGWVPGEKGVDSRVADLFPSATYLGYHAHWPQYDAEIERNGACEYLSGQECYSDGSGLHAEPVLDDFIRRGDVAVWEALQERHDGLKEGATA